MKKIIQFFNSLLFLPVAIVSVLYVYWLLTIPVDEAFLVGAFLLAIYFVGTIFVRVAELHWAFSLLVFLILLPISIYVSVLEFWAHEWITYDLEMHSHLIGLLIAIILLFIYAVPIFQHKVHFNKAAVMKLLLFTAALPFFTLNFGYFVVYYSSTEIIEQVQFENSTYLIVHAEDSDFHGYNTFYKCSVWRFSCRSLSASWNPMRWTIIVDDQNKEVSVFETGRSSLVYTDGENPRAYTSAGGNLHDHSYYLSEQCNNLNNDAGYYQCESYTYIPYKCNSQSILCEAIPIQYTVEDYRFYYWAENNVKNEISLYDDNDDLIFTYGIHSHCYADGCKILE